MAEGHTIKYQQISSYTVKYIHESAIMEKVYDKCCSIGVHKNLIIAYF